MCIRDSWYRVFPGQHTVADYRKRSDIPVAANKPSPFLYLFVSVLVVKLVLALLVSVFVGRAVWPRFRVAFGDFPGSG